MRKRRGHNEGTIYERKDANGRVRGHQAQISLPGGKRKTYSGKTKVEVQKKLEEAKALRAQGRLVATQSQTVKMYLTDWLRRVEHSLAGRTLEAYSLNVRRVLPHLGHLRLDLLAPVHVQDCYAMLLRSGLRPSTVRQVHMVLHKALHDAVRLDVVQRNATEGAIVPKSKLEEMHTLSAEQLGMLFDATRDDRFDALWRLLSTSGLRIGEGLGLKWSDIDFEDPLLSCADHFSGSREGAWYSWNRRLS